MWNKLVYQPCDGSLSLVSVRLLGRVRTVELWPAESVTGSTAGESDGKVSAVVGKVTSVPGGTRDVLVLDVTVVDTLPVDDERWVTTVFAVVVDVSVAERVVEFGPLVG